MSAYVRSAFRGLPLEAGSGRALGSGACSASSSAASPVNAPIPLRGGPPATVVVAVLIGVYAAALAAVRPGGRRCSSRRRRSSPRSSCPGRSPRWPGWRASPSRFRSSRSPSSSRTGNGFDAPFVLASAVVLRAIVVAAVSTRTDHLRREATLARRLDSVLEIAERLATTHDRAALLRAIVDETHRGIEADATVLRLVHEDRLEVVAWAGIDDATAARLPVFNQGESWFGEISQSGRPWVVDDSRRAAVAPVYDRYAGVFEFRGDIVVPLTREGKVIGSLSAVTFEPRDWQHSDVAFVMALGTHAAIALENADLIAQTQQRAAQLGVLQAASARLSRASGVEAVGRAIVEETRRIIDYHNARVYVLEPAATSSRSRSRASSAPTSRSTSRCSGASSARASRAGSPSTACRCSSTTRTSTRAARRSPAPTTSTSRCSSCRWPTTARRRGDHALEARPQPVRRRRPAAAADPRRPGGDGPRVGPPAGPQPGPRRASCGGCST